MGDEKLFVVLPAYNEEARIAKVIAEVKQYGAHIVVVDDASSDRTVAVVERQGVEVLSHVVNRGQGAALQTGDEFALMHGADIIVHFDADGQHQAKDIPRVIQPVQEEVVDVVLGSRFLLKTASQIPWTKRFLILPLARWVNFLFTGLPLTDGHNGWRALSRAAAQKIIITQDRMAHNTEIPMLIKKHHLSYKEVPVEIIYHEYGQGFWDGVKILLDLLKRKFLL